MRGDRTVLPSRGGLDMQYALGTPCREQYIKNALRRVPHRDNWMRSMREWPSVVSSLDFPAELLLGTRRWPHLSVGPGRRPSW